MFPRSLEPLLEADAGNGAGAGGASPSQPSAPTTSAAPSTSATTPTPTTGSVPGASGGAGGGQPTTPPSTTTPGFGAASSPATAATAPQPQAGQFSGPTAAAQPQQANPIDLIRQLPPQFQQLLQMGYQAATQRQQQPAQPQQTQQSQGPKNPFGVPNEDFFALRNYLTRDAMGNIIPTPDAPLDAVQRFKAYVDAKEKADHGFFQNPHQFLQPVIEQMVQPLLQKAIEQQFGQREVRSEAQAIFQQVSDWAIAKDQAGRPMYDFNPLTGERTERLTPAGQLYHGFLNSGRQMGINGPGNLHRYASQMLQSVIAQHQAQQAQAPAQGAAAAQQFVQQAAAGGQIPPQPSPSNVPAPQPPRSLREALAETFRQNGINDTALETQMRLPQGTAA